MKNKTKKVGTHCSHLLIVSQLYHSYFYLNSSYVHNDKQLFLFHCSIILRRSLLIQTPGSECSLQGSQSWWQRAIAIHLTIIPSQHHVAFHCAHLGESLVRLPVFSSVFVHTLEANIGKRYGLLYHHILGSLYLYDFAFTSFCPNPYLMLHFIET